jgi:hypothetical protein
MHIWEIWQVYQGKPSLRGSYYQWRDADGTIQLMRLLQPNIIFDLRYMGTSVQQKSNPLAQ